MVLHAPIRSAVLWAALGLVTVFLLALDLGLFRKRARRADPTLRGALGWTAIWAGLAAVFGVALTLHQGARAGGEFFTGYVLEQALSVDNLLVMLLVFTQFRVPRSAQRPVLVMGVVGAFVLRTVMILGGSALVGRFHFLTHVLGAFLVYAAIKLFRSDDAPTEERPPLPWLQKLLGRFIPMTERIEGERFFVRIAGVLHATPLFFALVTIELADAIFALDSIPAVLGVSQNSVVVLASNLFAVLGLRSLFFAISGLVERLRYLKHGLAVVLAMVGAKMIVAMFWEPSGWVTPAFVAGTLGITLFLSLRKPPQAEGERDHARQS